MYFSNPRVTAVGEQPLQVSLWDQRPVGAFCSAAEKAGVWGIRCLWVHTETMDSRELFQQLRGSSLSRRSGTQYSPRETQLGEAQSWRPGYVTRSCVQKKKKCLSEAQGPEMFMAHTQKNYLRNVLRDLSPTLSVPWSILFYHHPRGDSWQSSSHTQTSLPVFFPLCYWWVLIRVLFFWDNVAQLWPRPPSNLMCM